MAKGFTKTQSKERLKTSIRDYTDLSERIKSIQNIKGSFELRTVKREFVHFQLCRIDENLTMVQYLFSQLGSQSPLIEVIGSKSKLFKIYLKEFEIIWKLNK